MYSKAMTVQYANVCYDPVSPSIMK